MNIRLLRRIQRQILKEPKQFWMDAFFGNDVRWDVPNCGTTACIAGWATALAINKNPRQAWLSGVDARMRGQLTLKLTCAQASNLFYLDAWPRKFHTAYENALISRRYAAAARIGAKRIDHFIKTKGQ